MVENQFILKPIGLLDRDSARILADDIRSAARGQRVFIDCGGMEAALWEGVDELKKILGEVEGSFEFINIPEQMRSQMELCDLSAKFEKRFRKSIIRSRSAILCHKCEEEVRVKRAGLYACPNCGVRFYTDGQGHSTFYESLRKLV